MSPRCRNHHFQTKSLRIYLSHFIWADNSPPPNWAKFWIQFSCFIHFVYFWPLSPSGSICRLYIPPPPPQSLGMIDYFLLNEREKHWDVLYAVEGLWRLFNILYLLNRGWSVCSDWLPRGATWRVRQWTSRGEWGRVLPIRRESWTELYVSSRATVFHQLTRNFWRVRNIFLSTVRSLSPKTLASLSMLC